jgi:tRNA A-37 threonylcarbamoyl transferase component Bud32
MSMDSLRASLADRYTIERELGQGGMATVYLAEDLKHKRKVAIKVLKPELAAVLGAERFVIEITTTAALQHPHILPLFDSGEADGFLYYVMPFIDGETLRAKLDRETQLGIDESVRITSDVASALHYAHTHGVIHRDIKPENILLHEGRPMVADFGIALALSAAAGGRMTETGMSLGTPHYMSPEQATAEKEITARSDVYSLGSVLYEMLTGNPPHVGASAQQIIMKIITTPAELVTVHRKSVPPNVAAAVAKSLEKLPADRFDSAKAFGEALSNPGFATVGLTGIAPATVPARQRGLVAGFAVVAVASMALAWWGWQRPAPSPQPTQLRVTLTSQPILPGQIGRTVALSPDGSIIAFADTTGGQAQIWLKVAVNPDATPLPGTEGALAATFSPDGNSLAFIAGGKLRTIAVTGGAVRTIGDSAVRNVVTPPSVAWLDDGTIIYTTYSFGLGVIPPEGEVRYFNYLATHGGIASVGALRAGGQAMVGLCLWGCPSARLFLVDLTTGALDTLVENAVRGWQLDDGRVVFVTLDGTASVAPFDEDTRRLTSTPTPIFDGISGSRYHIDLAVARNGTLLYALGSPYAGRTQTEAVWVTRNGRVTPVDSSWIFRASDNGGIRLSPDGQQVAVGTIIDGLEAVLVKRLDTGPSSRLTLETASQRPEWSEGSHHIWFAAQLGPNRSELRRTRADGSGKAETILAASRAIWEVLPLADSNKMIVRLGVPATRDIYLFDRSKGSGDSAMVPLVADDRFEEASMALSPDQRWLAYTSNESDRYEVYVRPYPDVNANRWMISTAGGNEPRWSPNGRELFYHAADGNLIAVAYTTAGGFTPGASTVLFSATEFLHNTATSNFDVSPDGERFIYTRARGAGVEGHATVILAQHWLHATRDDKKRLP